MRGSLSARIAAVVLVLSLAAPAMAAPRRDDSPIDSFERTISRIISNIQHIFDLGSAIQPPK